MALINKSQISEQWVSEQALDSSSLAQSKAQALTKMLWSYLSADYHHVLSKFPTCDVIGDASYIFSELKHFSFVASKILKFFGFAWNRHLSLFSLDGLVDKIILLPVWINNWALDVTGFV